MFSLLLCFRSVIGRMSLAEGQERAPERAGARAKSRSRGLADIDPKFISQVSSCVFSLSKIRVDI